MKAFKYIAVGLGTLLGVKYLFTLNRAKEKILTTVKAEKESITAQGIGLLVKYNIKNPTKAMIKMTPPLIQIKHNAKTLASSTMKTVEIPNEVKDESGKILIQPFKETGEITTRIHLPWMSVLSLSPQLFHRLQNPNSNAPIPIDLQTTAQLYTAIGNTPYDSTTTIKL